LIRFVCRVAWRLWCWIELGVFTLVMYLLSWLPRALTRSFYFTLFRF